MTSRLQSSSKSSMEAGLFSLVVGRFTPAWNEPEVPLSTARSTTFNILADMESLEYVSFDPPVDSLVRGFVGCSEFALLNLAGRGVRESLVTPVSRLMAYNTRSLDIV